MTFQIPHENSTVIPVSFGIGLLLAGRYILGTAAIAIGAVAYLRSNLPEAKNQRTTSRGPAARWHDLTYTEKLGSIDNWYYSNNNETVGPLGEGALLHLLKDNRISKDTLVYNSIISGEWMAFEQTHLFQNRITTK